MGFNEVYMVLQELFPQVDYRVLKAVSSQHPEDADMAAEVVLFEIIPSLPKQPLTVGSSSNSQSSLGFIDGGGKACQVSSTTYQAVTNPFAAEHLSIDGSLLGATEVVEPVIVERTTMSSDHDANNSKTEAKCGDEPLLLESFGVSNNVNVDSDSSILIPESVSLDTTDQVRVEIGGENIGNKTLTASESTKFVGIPETNFAATQESDPSSSKALDKDDFAVKFVNLEDESTMSSMLTRSEELSRSVYIDEVIEDAKKNKKTLALAMDSVIDFMRAVESKEQAAEQAKEDAKRGCSDIVAKVDEVKHALSRAKEANDMHCGEVHAEKAILRTELRELQTRLFILSDHTNNSLGILDEMRRGLEIRMAAALEQIAAAEDEKLEQERLAREALLHEESQMERVVEESKKLKLEAEENSKLQEFLMDRGHAIDILQGEIAVTCEDVLLLKEKFDKRIPLSRSLFSTQTSSILCSSSSSYKTTVTPYEPEAAETYETPKNSCELGDPSGILGLRSDASHKSPTETASSVIGDEEKVDERKRILGDDDDGWELFDNGDLLVR